ncbi:MAG: xanthine dehydrogenase accessory protein XdhC [Alphaproteobacteria bacterium]|nr:xanthine dehydrogenase accessory protein XdhC [Alphaproteobacteria bacterium]
MTVWSTILRIVEAGEGACLVSVAVTEGSAPRDAGAHMVVTARGYHGTIGGGTLEWRAIAEAQALLGRGPAVKLASHALGPDLGQCCGGRVMLVSEVFGGTSLAELRELAAREVEGAFSLSRHGRIMSFGEERRHIYLFGAGHVGRALALALAPLPFDVTWADPRPEAFPAAHPANVKTVVAADPAAILAKAPGASLVFVMSHSHALDLAIVDCALRNPAIAHVGVIGSATKRARFVSRLRQAGVAEDRISGLICPIGVAGVASKIPAAIAAATVAQILVLDEELRLARAAPEPHHGGQRAGGTP